MSADLEQKTIETYDMNAAEWSQAHTKLNQWYWAIGRLHALAPTGTLLEIGCGGGRDAAELIGAGYDYFGTDASLGMVQVAQATVPAGVFQQCSVYDLASLGKTFDAFWACAVLLHMPKSRIDEALGALAAVLNGGAVGMISMKDGDKEEFEVRDADGLHEERLFAYWPKDVFVEALSRHSFSIIEYRYQPVSQRTNWHVFFVRKDATR